MTLNIIVSNEDITERHKIVINLYKKFDKYKIYSDRQLFNHIRNPIELDQYKIIYKNDTPVAFTSWAFLDLEAENHYKKTGQMLDKFWLSGDRCWIIDSICHDENFNAVYDWAKRYFTATLGVDKPVSWLRIGENYSVKESNTRYTKEEYI